MTFGLPTLNSYAADDTNYIAKFNSDKASLDTAFSGLQSDINGVQTGSGAAFLDDWSRKGPIAEVWPDGVLGAYSLVLDMSDLSNGNVSLISQNQSNQSVCILGGVRRFVIGNLTTNLDSIVADGNHTVYMGVVVNGTLGLDAKLDTVQGNVGLALYTLPLNRTSGAWTVRTNYLPARIEKTVYWDNTVEQLRQDTAQVITLPFHNDLGQGDGVINQTSDALFSTLVQFVVPYDHVWVGGDATYTSSVQFTTINIVNDTISRQAMTGTSTNGSTSAPVAVLATLAGSAFAANSKYLVQFTSLSGTSVLTKLNLSLYLKRAYNAPLWT